MTRTVTTTHNQAVGAYGERVAADHLVAQGMVVLDLVLRDGAVLVACEVKTRTSFRHGTPHEAITDAKLARLQRLASRWADERGVQPTEIRIDLVAVLRPLKGRSLVEHVRGVA